MSAKRAKTIAMVDIVNFMHISRSSSIFLLELGTVKAKSNVNPKVGITKPFLKSVLKNIRIKMQ